MRLSPLRSLTPSLLRSTPLSLLVVLATVPFLLAWTFSSGAPPRQTGAPVPGGGVEANCTTCHVTFELNSGTGSVTVSGPETYLPGETVTLTVTVDNTTELAGDQLEQGFQVTVKDAAFEPTGTLGLADDVRTQFAWDDPAYVTHTSEGSLASSWTVTWTAPATDPPAEVTAYAVGNAANGDGGTGGDYVYTDAFTMRARGVANEDERLPTALRVEAPYPNPLPAAHPLAVPFALENPGEVAVALYDAGGRMVAKVAAQAYGSGAHEAVIAPDDLPAGVYFVAVEAAGAQTVRAISIVR